MGIQSVFKILLLLGCILASQPLLAQGPQTVPSVIAGAPQLVVSVK